MVVPTFDINSKTDINRFLRWLAENGLLIHPDDQIVWLLDDKTPPNITYEQAAYLDEVMDACFDVCKENGWEIYEFVYDIINGKEKENLSS